MPFIVLLGFGLLVGAVGVSLANRSGATQRIIRFTGREQREASATASSVGEQFMASPPAEAARMLHETITRGEGGGVVSDATAVALSLGRMWLGRSRRTSGEAVDFVAALRSHGRDALGTELLAHWRSTHPV